MKRVISLFMSLAFIALLAMNAYAKFTKFGDVTADGKINSSDALMVLTASVGLKALTADEKKAADVDGNGKINSSDALLILNHSVGIIDEFPVDSMTPEPGLSHDVF